MPAMKELVRGVDRYKHFIGGQWVESTVKEWIDVENPATEEIIASVPNGGADDADRALVAARAAQPAWEAMPPASRGQLLRDLARLILENRERLARIVVAEQGKPIQEARGEIEGAALLSDLCRRGGATHHRRNHSVRHAGRADLDPARRPWSRRCAHGLELSGGPDVPQDRPGAGRGQYRRRQIP